MKMPLHCVPMCALIKSTIVRSNNLSRSQTETKNAKSACYSFLKKSSGCTHTGCVCVFFKKCKPRGEGACERVHYLCTHTHTSATPLQKLCPSICNSSHTGGESPPPLSLSPPLRTSYICIKALTLTYGQTSIRIYLVTKNTFRIFWLLVASHPWHLIYMRTSRKPDILKEHVCVCVCVLWQGSISEHQIIFLPENIPDIEYSKYYIFQLK